MITAGEKNFFLEQGYLHVPGVLQGDHLALIQAEFDRVWELEKPKVNQHRLLKHNLTLAGKRRRIRTTLAAAGSQNARPRYPSI